jgi:hypothetical protein
MVCPCQLLKKKRAGNSKKKNGIVSGVLRMLQPKIKNKSRVRLLRVRSLSPVRAKVSNNNHK